MDPDAGKLVSLAHQSVICGRLDLDQRRKVLFSLGFRQFRH
jgi:hypothetical protein